MNNKNSEKVSKNCSALKEQDYMNSTTNDYLNEATYGMNGKAITFNDMIKTVFKQKIINIFINTPNVKFSNDISSLLTDNQLSPKPFFTFVSNTRGSMKHDALGRVEHHILYGDKPETIMMALQDHSKLHNKINYELVNNLPDYMHEIYINYYYNPLQELKEMKGSYSEDILRLALFEDCIRRIVAELQRIGIDLNSFKSDINKKEVEKNNLKNSFGIVSNVEKENDKDLSEINTIEEAFTLLNKE